MIVRKIFNFYIWITARPSMQKLNEKAFRAILGSLGYMNFSEDFKLTGEKKLLKLLQKSQPIRLALDIGANRGQWAEMALLTSVEKIISFEPQVIPFKALTTLSDIYPKRLEAHNFALGELDQTLMMHVHDSSSELSFISSEITELPLLSGRTSAFQEINVKTLDGLYDRDKKKFAEVDFIKIDTEGYEFETLLGMSNLINEIKPSFIQLEMNWHQLFKCHTLYQISKLLEDYTVHQIFPYGTIIHEIDPKSPARNIFALSNFIFIKKNLSKMFTSS
jgi:FkbM family methyltransferase